MSNALSNLRNAATYEGIEHRIRELHTDLPGISNVNLRGRFFNLTFRNKKITAGSLQNLFMIKLYVTVYLEKNFKKH